MAVSDMDKQHARRDIIRALNKLITRAYTDVTCCEYDALKTARNIIDLQYRLTDKELIERHRNNG